MGGRGAGAHPAGGPSLAPTGTIDRVRYAVGWGWMGTRAAPSPRLAKGEVVDIKDVYRPRVVTCPPAATLREVAARMEEADSGIVALVDGGRLVGVVSERDLVRAVAAGVDPAGAPASDWATTDVATVGIEEEAEVAARLMVERGVRRLPVVGDGGELVGLVSMRDLFTVETVLGRSIPPGESG